MIILPARKRLESRRDKLYQRLHSAHCANILHVESIMRQIHIINTKLLTYFERDHEPKEIFTDEDTA